MGGCVASRPLPQGDEFTKNKLESSLERSVDKSGALKSFKSSSSSWKNHIVAKTQGSGQDEELPCCGGGGLDIEPNGTSEILPFFVEAERLASLRALKMIQHTPESRFDSITSIMKAIYQVPISALTLLEDDTIHFHSRAGEWAKTSARAGSFCERILEGASPRMLVVEDAQADTRFCKNKYVTGKPYIRFYAGAPLVGSTGHRYGTLCIIDFKPRRFTAEQYLMLCHFAELATRELERDRIRNADQSELKNALRGAKSATGQVLRAMDALNEAVMLTDVSQPEWPVVYCNEAWSKATDIAPEISRSSSASSSAVNNVGDDLTAPPLKALAPFWHLFKGKALDPGGVATAMAAARLGKPFTLSVRSAVTSGDVINLRFKPVGEPGRLGAAAMPQVAVPAGIGLDWMLQSTGDGNTPKAPRLGRAEEPISADLNNKKRAQLAAALSVLSGTPLAEPQNNSIEKAAAAASAVAATLEHQDSGSSSITNAASATSSSLLPEPVYYLGVVLNQGPQAPPPRHFPISPFTSSPFVDNMETGAPGKMAEKANNIIGGNGIVKERYDTDAFHSSTLNGSFSSGTSGDDRLPSVGVNHINGKSGRNVSVTTTSTDTNPSTNLSEPTILKLQAAVQLACATEPVGDILNSKGAVEDAVQLQKAADEKKHITKAILESTKTAVADVTQCSSGAWGLIDRPPPLLRDVTLGALVGNGSNSRCYRGVWKKERVAVKVSDMWRESYDSAPSLFSLPVDDLPKHPNLVAVLASAVVTSPTGIPNRMHLEVWTVEEFCNRGQLGDAIECGKIHGAEYINNTCFAGSSTAASSASGGSSPRAAGVYDLRAIIATAYDIALGMAALHSTGTIHGALTSNNVLLTSDPSEKYRGWKALVGDYALVASEATLNGDAQQYKRVTSTPSYTGSSANGFYGNYCDDVFDDGDEGQQQNHPLSKFRGTTVRAMNQAPCAAHIPPDVLLGAPMTPSSDVYSFGVVLWELVSARRAWRTLRPMEVVHAVAVQGCRLPTQIKGVPAPVKDLMEQCLADDAETRPNFLEVAEMLKQMEI